MLKSKQKSVFTEQGFGKTFRRSLIKDFVRVKLSGFCEGKTFTESFTLTKSLIESFRCSLSKDLGKTLWPRCCGAAALEEKHRSHQLFLLIVTLIDLGHPSWGHQLFGDDDQGWIKSWIFYLWYTVLEHMECLWKTVLWFSGWAWQTVSECPIFIGR